METKVIKNVFAKAYKKRAKYSSVLTNGMKSNFKGPSNPNAKSTISGVFIDLFYHYVKGDVVFSTKGMVLTAKSKEFTSEWDMDTSNVTITGEEIQTVHWMLYSLYLHNLIQNSRVAQSHIANISILTNKGEFFLDEKCEESVSYLCDELYFFGKNSYPADITQNIDVVNNDLSSDSKDKDKPKTTRKRATKKVEKEEVVKGFDTTPYHLSFDRDLDEEELSRIPKLNLGVDIQVPEFVGFNAEIIKGEHEGMSPINNLLWYGPSGTGKSFSTKILAQLLNLPHYQFIFSKGIDEMSIVAGADVKDGTVTYNDSEVVKAVRDGGVIEFQEFYNAQPSVLTFLNEVLEEGQLRLANGKVIKRHPNCIIVATSNISYAGCQMIDFSTDDRFVIQEHIQDVEDEVLIKRIVFESNNKDKALVTKLVKAYRDIKLALDEEEWDEGISSIRKLTSWAQACKYSKSVIAAAERTFLSGISKDYAKRKEIIDTYLIHTFKA